MMHDYYKMKTLIDFDNSDLCDYGLIGKNKHGSNLLITETPHNTNAQEG